MADLDGLTHFGFDPTCSAAGLSNATVPSQRSCHALGGHTALERGQSLLDATFRAAIRDCPAGSDHVVPISGGLDSRTILAGILDHIPSDRITTVTLGVPGTWDFRFGQAVAAEAGVDHDAISLTDMDWSIDALETTARGMGVFNQVFAENAFRQAIYDPYPDDAVRWHGFLGGVLAGSNLADNQFFDWDNALDWFCGWSATANEEFRDRRAARSLLPDVPLVSRDRLPFDEQLDFAIRQQCFIRPTARSDTVYPFTDSEWVAFMLSLPREWRLERSFFGTLLQRWSPELFKIRTTAANGSHLSDPWWRRRLRTAITWAVYDAKDALRMNPTHPSNMYWNWNAAFRDPRQLKREASELLRSLGARCVQMNTDPIEVFDRHQNGEDLGATIRSLGSMELYLRSV